MMRFFAFMLVVSSGFAQTPNLAREVVNGRVTQLRNIHTVAAMAWRYERLDGRGSSTSDRLTGSALAPGAVTRAMDDPSEAVRWAVIYADGMTAGDPVVIDELIGSRREALRSIPTLEQEMRDVMEGRDSLQALRDRLEATARTPGSPIAPPRDNMAFSSFLHLLHMSDDAAYLGPLALRELARLRGLLEASKPALR